MVRQISALAMSGGGLHESYLGFFSTSLEQVQKARGH